jgi:pyruvate-formate lyase-activating enzyme
MKLPYLTFCDKDGKIYHHPRLRMAAQSMDRFVLPKRLELISLPKGSTLFYLPSRFPVGFNLRTKEFEVLKEFEGKKVFSLSAFPIPAYLRLYTPATIVDKFKPLPLWAYSACGFYKGNFYITAKRVDKRIRQSPHFYDNKLVKKNVISALKEYPDNRLYKHLANCALNYNCLAAKNLFLKRWEAPLPTARFCNARCIGCLSAKGAECISSHQRITFKPKAAEIAEVAINHLKEAREAIVSFGQGCEGEPLLETKEIAKAIIKIREKTKRGTINMNTNASMPKKIKALCEAGIDSFRVSLNSPQERFYNLYFRPVGYKFCDILKSIEIAKKYNKFVSINLFIFPGFSDSASQIKALVKFLRKTKVDMIQWRNLNIDPEYYLKQLPCKKLNPQGVLYLINTIKKEFPKIKHGYFNLPKEEFLW